MKYFNITGHSRSPARVSWGGDGYIKKRFSDCHDKIFGFMNGNRGGMGMRVCVCVCVSVCKHEI